MCCYHVYAALSVINLAAPIALMKLMSRDGVIGEFEEKSSSDEDLRTLIIVVNAFACTFFGSNFICFYNALSMQVKLDSNFEMSLSISITRRLSVRASGAP